MADNTLQTAAANIATDDIAGVHYQRVKATFGADGTATDVTDTTPLPIKVLANGLISTGNNSTVNLAANATFTGTAEDISEFAVVTISIMTSHASATDGFVFQQSTDGVNWDLTDTYSIPANTGKAFSFGAIAKFCRIVYTNGATATTAFRLQTIFSKSNIKASSVRPQDGRTNDNDTEETTALGMAYDAVSNTWNRVRSSAKSVQATSALAVQNMKDSGRVNVAITCYQAAGIITTEALFGAAIFSRSLDAAAATTGNQFTVTAGKRFRIQTVEVSIKNTGATVSASKLALRALAAGGTITNTSPIQAIWDVGSNNAVANNYIGPVVWTVPDGMELQGGSTFGLTNLSSAATLLHTITITGFEY